MFRPDERSSSARDRRHDARSVRRLQVLGERCSGTNFVTELLCRNLQLEPTEAVGFKHWFVEPDRPVPHDVLVVCVERRVEDWVRSLHRNPWHAHPSLKALPIEAFVRAEWHCVWDDTRFGIGPADPRWGTEMMHERDPQTGTRFSDALAMRRAKHANWRVVLQRAAHGAWLHYEEAAADPHGTVARMAAVIGRDVMRAVDPVTSYKGEGGSGAGTRTGYVPRHYAPLPATALSHVMAHA